MPTVKLFIDSPYVSGKRTKTGEKVLNNKETKIYLCLIIEQGKHQETSAAEKNKMLKISTGLAILPKHWKFETQEVKPSAMSSVTINDALKKKKAALLEKYIQITDEVPDLDWDGIKENLKAFVKTGATPILSEKNKSFMAVYDDYINTKSRDVSYGTFQKYETLKNALKDFENKKKYRLTFDRIDLIFYDKFKDYLQTRTARGKMKSRNDSQQKHGLLNATTGKYISNLKNFMKWSLDRDYHSSIHFQKDDFRSNPKPKNEAKQDIVTLRIDELTKFYFHDFSDNPRLEKVRDVFCFAAFTAQRWSDIELFNKDQIKGDWWLFTSAKTKKEIKVPLVGYAAPAVDILKKYDFKLPKISNQKFNMYLKEAGRAAGLDREVIIVRKVGETVIEFKNPLSEFMQSHMGRRTAVSLLLNHHNMPLHKVRAITAHSDLKTLDGYLDDDDKELKNSMSQTTSIHDGLLKVVKSTAG